MTTVSVSPTYQTVTINRAPTLAIESSTNNIVSVGAITTVSITPTLQTLTIGQQPTLAIESAAYSVVSVGIQGPPGATGGVPVYLSAEKDGEVLEYNGLTDLWNNKAPDKSPVFTYAGGLLTRVDYASGNYKTLTYTAGVLAQLVYVLPGRTVTKVFSYGIDGSLVSISQSEVYN